MGEAPAIAWTKLLSSGSSSLSPALLDFFIKNGFQIPFKVLWLTTTNDGSIYIVTVAGYEPIRITKFNSDGSESWSTLEGEESGRYSSVLNADSDGSIYITGITTLGYGPYVNGVSSPIIDIFVTKINSNGSKEWTKLGGNTQSYEHYVNSKIIYGDGSAYIVQSANPGSDDALIAKLNIDASKAWTKMLSGAYFKFATGISIATDGSTYITGFKDGNDKTDSGYPNAFIIKYRSDGSKEWTKWLGGDFGSTRSSAVSTSVDGSIYITGETFGNLDSQTNSGGYDTFIAKFSSNGSKLWTKLIGGKSDDHATAVSTSSDGSVYISGYTSSSFDGQTNSGSTDAFITKLSSDGSKVWTKLIGGEGNESSFGVNTSNDGSIYIVGYKDGNIAGKGDVGGFITKLNSDGSSSNTGTESIYYNPTTNNTLTSWNIYRVDNSVKAGDIVSQWFGTAAPATTQLQDISETKLMDVAATWTDKVQINRVVKATDAGGKIEAKQVDLNSTNIGSILQGGNGDDQLQGKAGWDIFDAGDGNDFIRAGNGRDIISGGAGRDELHGDFGWNTYRSEKDGVSDLIAIKSDHYLVNWIYGKAGNSPNGEKSDIIEGLDATDKIRIIGVDTSEITFAANVSAKGVTGIGIYGKGILEALYTGGDLTVAQITQMTSGDASAAAMSNSINAYGVW